MNHFEAMLNGWQTGEPAPSQSSCPDDGHGPPTPPLEAYRDEFPTPEGFSPHGDAASLTPDVKPKQGFGLIRADRLELREPEYLVQDLIETETLGLLFGDPGSGKSFAALGVACCVATGTPFHGREVKRGAVIYICGEGKNGIKRRLAAWETHTGVSLNGQPLFVSRVAARLMSSESVCEVIQAIDGAASHADRDVVLIIIDTLNRNMGAGDESSTQDMTAFIAAVDLVKNRYQSSALIVHHTGHGNKERARGSMSLLGALDAEYRVEKVAGGTIQLTNTKMKDAASPPPMAFDLLKVEIGHTRSGTPITSAVLVETEAKAGKRGGLPEKTRQALNTFMEAKKDGIHGDNLLEGVTVGEWRVVFYRRSTLDSPDSKKKAFQRARDDLVARQMLTVRDNVYSLARVPPDFSL